MTTDHGRTFRVSGFSGARDNEPASLEVTWTELAASLSTHDTRAEKDGPAWSPARFEGARAVANVKALCALVFDLDDADPQLSDAGAARLDSLAHAWHTTHSGGWRLTIPLERDIGPAELPGLWASVSAALGISPDANSRDAARLFYLPSCPPGGAPLAHVHQGDFLNPSDFGGALQTPESRPAEKSASGEKLENFGPLDLALVVAAVEATRSPTRGAVLRILKGEFTPAPGERNSSWHRALSALGQYLPEGASVDAWMELVAVSLRKMDLAGESYDAWHAALKHSLARALERNDARHAQASAMRGSIDKLAPAPDAGSTRGQTVTGLVMRETKTGAVPDNVGFNVEQILERGHLFVDQLRWNELTREVEAGPGTPFDGQPLEYYDVVLQNWLARSEYGIRVPRDTAAANLLLVAQRHAYNPVREWLEGLKWDGTPRIDGFLWNLCGAEGNPEWVNLVSRKFFISAVARAMSPGAKVDTMLVLQGPQGVGKSKLVRCLANGWGTSLKLDVHNKDSVQVATSNWLVELAELATLKRSDVESLKAFLTNQHDDVRMPYARTNQKYPRRCVFVGTTNDHEFLEDESGNRRFWPVSVGRIDYDAIEAAVPQLWAEAVHAFNTGEKWWLDAGHDALAESETSVYARESRSEAAAGRILEWYARKEKRSRYLTSREVAQHVFMIGASEQMKEHYMYKIIGSAMRLLGAKRYRGSLHGVRQWYFEMPDNLIQGERVETTDKDTYLQIAESRTTGAK